VDDIPLIKALKRVAMENMLNLTLELQQDYGVYFVFQAAGVRTPFGHEAIFVSKDSLGTMSQKTIYNFILSRLREYNIIA
jgi:hypothetical protein